MPLETLSVVHAVHDIQRGGAVVIQHGSQGRIVNQHPGWAATTYTVEFSPVSGGTLPGGAVPGGTVTLVGLTEHDVEPAHRSAMVDVDVPAAW